MYTDFFGLTEKPFSITPNPRYLYLTETYSDALAHLVYGISEGGGFIQLTGEVGTGKTTLLRTVLEQSTDDAKIAVILNPNLSELEFLRAICVELKIRMSGRPTRSDLIEFLNRYLLNAHRRGTRVVLIVDEAQSMDSALLEQIRLLTNLETAHQKLLQIILIGQPELRETLSRREMRQVAQRITGRVHLLPLSARDSAKYVQHRMRVANARGNVFQPAALRALHRHSGGIPRLINTIADRALLAGYATGSGQISGRLVTLAAAEVLGQKPRRLQYLPPILLGLLGVSAIVASLFLLTSAQAAGIPVPLG